MHMFYYMLIWRFYGNETLRYYCVSVWQFIIVIIIIIVNCT